MLSAQRLRALLRLDTAAARAELGQWRSIPAMEGIGDVLGQAAFAPADSALFQRLAADRQASQLRGGHAGSSTISVSLADILMWRGAPTATVMTVLEAIPARDAQFNGFLRGRSFDPIRNDPRFQRLWVGTSP